MTKHYTRLHIEILRQGRSFADLARETGIHQQAIYEYAHDRRRPERLAGRHHVIALARALGVHASVVTDRGAYSIEPVAISDLVTT